LFPICAVSFPFKTFTSCFYKHIYVCIIWISTKPCITHAEGINTYMPYASKYAYIYIYIYIYLLFCYYFTCDQMLLPVGRLLSEIYCLVYVGCPLCREDGSAICSAIAHWLELRRTRNHALLSHLRRPQPGGPGYQPYAPAALYSQKHFSAPGTLLC
jgi:hypothetical protein